LSVLLPNTPEGRTIRTQITKSGTSIGANYREANRSRSKADFTNKIKICESESSETLYWMEIIDDLKWIESQKTVEQIEEADEILSIFTSIGKSLKTYFFDSKYSRHFRHSRHSRHLQTYTKENEV